MKACKINYNKGILDNYRIQFPEDVDVMKLVVKHGISGNVYENELGFDTSCERDKQLILVARIA